MEEDLKQVLALLAKQERDRVDERAAEQVARDDDRSRIEKLHAGVQELKTSVDAIRNNQGIIYDPLTQWEEAIPFCLTCNKVSRCDNTYIIDTEGSEFQSMSLTERSTAFVNNTLPKIRHQMLWRSKRNVNNK